MFDRTRAEFSSKALLKNYEAIQSLVPGQSILAMVKANAYGHGGAWAAKILADEPTLYGLGVATLEEGAEVRKALGARRLRARIVVISGTALWSEQKGQFCEKYGLTATISSQEDWVRFFRGKWHERISYEIKFNTGMNRLGVSPGYARQIARALRNEPAVSHPSGVLSHLAMSENPDEKMSRQQRELFAQIRGELGSALPSAHFHLANSGAIWNAKKWGLDGLTDVVRPGISLYGIPPYPDAPARGLVPVMTVSSQVVAVHSLKAGERIGYGGTFKAREPVTVAVLAGGYGDGLKRALSNSGSVLLHQRQHPIVGTVSMDLMTALCSKTTQPGEWAQFLGPGTDAWAQARAAGTIPYELLTSVAARVERIYR